MIKGGSNTFQLNDTNDKPAYQLTFEWSQEQATLRKCLSRNIVYVYAAVFKRAIYNNQNKTFKWQRVYPMTNNKWITGTHKTAQSQLIPALTNALKTLKELLNPEKKGASQVEQESHLKIQGTKWTTQYVTINGQGNTVIHTYLLADGSLPDLVT